LVLLDGQDVIAPALDHLFADIAVREHGIACDDSALDREHAQQFQGRLVFVGLGVHPELADHGSDVRGVSRNQVNRGRLAVATPSGGLAVEGDLRGVIRPEPSPDPPPDAGLEVGDVDPAKDPRVGGLAEAASPGEPEQAEELPTPLLAVVGDRLVAGHAREQGDDGQREQGRQGMPLALRRTRIVNTFQEFHQRGVGFHASVLMRGAAEGIDWTTWI
jgi:hypothetical protein